ncbi:unnamed protein product [Acanthoscelides obtectus]|uniref:EIF3j n=1 Tax=Acanthoscelides obtectus TaxID=200917 RepID=A0A9P0M901_ACAOB|nr:unnamed protein product [Acanthoscelides obtectus]CAK1626022.1 Eukaryotic translation initiation factor 3 subunit J [Acanthoscelides obtectus]
MESWDDDTFVPSDVPAPTVAVVPNKWEGEDEDDEVKESWEDEDEEKEEKKKEENSKTETETKRPKKKSLAERIAEKERLKQEELERRLKDQEEDISPEERLRRQQESDLSLALETTFAAKNENCTIGDLTMPETKEEFETFAESLTKKLSPLTKSPEYVGFVEDVTRNLCASMSSFDIKKIKNAVDNLYLEKQKIEKGDKAKKSKAKSKARIRVEGDSL